MFLQLAWRNIWRNPRRTLVIMTAVIIGVWSMVFFGAVSRGMLVSMLDNGKSILTGDIQIHAQDYKEDPSIDNSIKGSVPLESVLAAELPEGSLWAPRLRVNSIISNARHSTGVTTVGMDVEKEVAISFIGGGLFQGEYLEADDRRGILIGQALLEKFETRLGNKMIIMTRDATGEIASKVFRIKGVFRSEMQATEKEFVFVTLAAARDLVQMETGFSEVSIRVPDQGLLETTARTLQDKLDASNCQVETWPEILPILKAYVGIFDAFMYIWYVVVFVAMGFGIVNTTLMAVYERTREFGLFKALGMKPWWIIRSVITESFFLLLTGIVAGNIVAIGFVMFFAKTGIDLSMFAAGAEFIGMSRIIYPVLTVSDFLAANITIFFLGLLVSLYPAVKAARFTPVETMRN